MIFVICFGDCIGCLWWGGFVLVFGVVLIVCFWYVWVLWLDCALQLLAGVALSCAGCAVTWLFVDVFALIDLLWI